MTLKQSKRKILLAEDDGDDAAFFFEFLQNRSDLELLPSVSNGAELISYLDTISAQEALPDVIVLDQNMPKLSGKETLSFLKTSDKYARIPVVIYSTYVGPQLEEECLDLGATLVETKPISREGYNKMIDEILKAA